MPDVFISHATEDKVKVARPLAEALIAQGLDVWYDEFSLNLGDSLQESIDRGIAESRFGIVILSKSFFEKDWPKKELNGFIAREIHGTKVILPVWHELDFEDIVKYSPTLANRVAVKTSEGMEQVINKIMKAVKNKSPNPTVGTRSQPLVEIYANKKSILVGRSIGFSGQCINSGNIVHLTAFGPGLYTEGKEIASPTVSTSGKWHFEWTPEISIEPGEYLMKVCDSLNRVSDELIFRIEKGAITVTACGTGIYFIGERIQLSGTSTVQTKEIYLSLIGQGSFSKQRKIDQLDITCQNSDPNTFTKVKIESDDTWSFIWDTSLIASELKTGYYTIYATESPLAINNLDKIAFSTNNVLIEQPFLSATIPQPSFVQGEPLYLAGTATGNPQKGVQIWIFGDEICLLKTVTVNPKHEYSLELHHEEAKELPSGQYFIVVQHPMMNNEFDVYLDADNKKVLSNYPKPGTELFSLEGPASKKGADAATALSMALNDSGIDDTYVKLTFLIEKPKIRLTKLMKNILGTYSRAQR